MAPTLCLNMILKNESKIIERLLKSVVHLISSYVICDTGSDDNTIEIIENFFKSYEKIKGCVIQEPFKNFEYNRTFALQKCYELKPTLGDSAEFVLLLDADMILNIGSFKISNDYDLYYFLQGTDTFYYKNTRIVRNDGKTKYLGVTHEYVSFPEEYKCKNCAKEEIFILDIGDGGCKSDKFERDARLLEQGIVDEPNNERYHFYLANTYNDLKRYDDAIEMYKKRVEFGRWHEEVFYSLYRIGLCYLYKNEPINSIFYWLKAFNAHPGRIESLYEIIKYYRNEGSHQLAYVFYKMAKEAIANHAAKNINKDNFLFLRNDQYVFGLDIEYTIFSGYLGNKDISKEVLNILNNCPYERDISLLLSNMKFYKNKITFMKEKGFDYSGDIEHKGEKFISSSCSLENNKDGKYVLNQRYVNYQIVRNNGAYIHANGESLSQVKTLNKYVLLSDEFKPEKVHLFKEDFGTQYISGKEDVKIKRMANGQYKYLCTAMRPSDNRIGVSVGDYNFHSKKMTQTHIKPSFNMDSHCEKNWVFKTDQEIVYKWHPLTITQIKGDFLEKISEHATPNLFRYIRGSTNACFINGEYWFVVHLVSEERPRHYYHMIVVIDGNNNVLRYSAPFVFEGEPIEYCLGFIVKWKQVIFTYSTWDSTSKLIVLSRKSIDQMLVVNK